MQPFTDREKEVLRRLAADESAEDAAAAMGISLPTLANHLRNVLEKIEPIDS